MRVDDSKKRVFKKLNQLKPKDHIGLIYSNKEEQLYVAIPFIKIGLEQGEMCVYVFDDNQYDDIVDAMRQEGIDVESAVEAGQLVIASKNETYLKNGSFNGDKFMNEIEETCKLAKSQGYTALRAAAEMTWALDDDDKELKKLIDYEIEVNTVFRDNDLISLCQYNLHRFPTQVIRDMIFTHPYVIYKGFERFFKYRGNISK